jgi:hypothetical protein
VQPPRIRLWAYVFRILSGGILVLATLGFITFGFEVVSAFRSEAPHWISVPFAIFVCLMLILLGTAGWYGLKVRSPDDLRRIRIGGPSRSDDSSRPES